MRHSHPAQIFGSPWLALLLLSEMTQSSGPGTDRICACPRKTFSPSTALRPAFASDSNQPGTSPSLHRSIFARQVNESDFSHDRLKITKRWIIGIQNRDMKYVKMIVVHSYLNAVIG